MIINVNNYDKPATVREMRRQLAQILSKMAGDQLVRYSFQATLENYEASNAKS